MAQIIKFPGQASKFGHKRVKRRARPSESPRQLPLFVHPAARIINLTERASPFEQALILDEQDDAKAAELYVQAIAEQDCVADAYCNLGIIESKQGNIARAFANFTTSLKHSPRHFEAHYNLGNMYLDVNDYRLAEIHYQIATEIDPSFPNVYFNLALAQAINNDFDAAVNALVTYQDLVSDEEGQHANDLLEGLRRSLAVIKHSRSG